MYDKQSEIYNKHNIDPIILKVVSDREPRVLFAYFEKSILYSPILNRNNYPDNIKLNTKTQTIYLTYEFQKSKVDGNSGREGRQHYRRVQDRELRNYGRSLATGTNVLNTEVSGQISNSTGSLFIILSGILPRLNWLDI